MNANKYFYNELIRIAKTVEDEADRAIVFSAAIQFAPNAMEPEITLTELPNGGYMYMENYLG